MNKLPRNPVIYEINTPVWLYDLSRKYGGAITLANVPATEWDALASFHIQAVWFMGVWERSPISVQISNQNPDLIREFQKALPDYAPGDNIGSAYSVRSYQVDDLWGGNQGLASARAALASRGIRTILDFVPNHVARDHRWVSEHPEYFIHGEIDDLLGKSGYYFESNETVIACGKDPFYPPWEDVAQLNAFHPALRSAAVDTLTEIAAMCDGVRCDMAMLLLNPVFSETWGEKAGKMPNSEYWSVVIEAIRLEHPDFLFIAEAYWDKEPELRSLGFDYCYDKKYYDHLVSGSADLILADLTRDREEQSHTLRFIENHDERRAAAAFPIRKALLASIAMATVPGAKLFHDGQFEGRRASVPVFLRRRMVEEINEDQIRFYQRLVRSSSSALLQNGYWKLCCINGWQDNHSYLSIVSWSWQQDDQILLVILNFADHPSQGMVQVPWERVKGSSWRLVDLIKGDVFERSGDEMSSTGLFVDLPGWDFHLLWFSRKISA